MGIIIDQVKLVRHSKRLGAVTVCNGLSLEIKSNEFVCIVGPSGCGKTSLLHALAGLIPISGGSMTIDGSEVIGPGKDRSVVFQEPHLLPWSTVWKNVLFSIEAHRKATADEKECARELIELMGLTAFRNAYPGELSGGMRQRVNIARALLTSPKVLLLDEPFSSLDAQTREVLQAELQRILSLTPTTAVFITHDVDEAVLLGDRVLVFTSMPAEVRGDLEVSLDKPRQPIVKEEPWFREICREVRELLRPQDVTIHADVDQHQREAEASSRYPMDALGSVMSNNGSTRDE